MSRTEDDLDAAFDRALRPWRAHERELGLLFSGGVDSALLAWELRARPNFVLSTVGVTGSADLRAAEEAAAVLRLPWSPSTIGPEDVERTTRLVEEELRGLSSVERTVLIAFATAVERAPVSPLLCGQGADELFLGYAHYRGLTPEEALQRSEGDLHRLRHRDWPTSLRVARRLGKSVIAPYLHPEFVEAAEHVPIGQRLPDPVPKAYFRNWARHRGLPELLATRPKRALQYGSGVERIVQRWK